MPSIKLQSSDGEVFPVDIDIAKQSVTIKQMLEDLDVKVPLIDWSIVIEELSYNSYYTISLHSKSHGAIFHKIVSKTKGSITFVRIFTFIINI